MLRQTTVALRMMIVLIVVLGLAFPLGVTAVAQVAFPHQANGSLVIEGGKPVGSSLIGQDFTAASYFHPRPSAAGNGYDPNSSSASNLGPSSRALVTDVRSRVASATQQDPGLRWGQVPVDMVTASASGLDPDISVADALAQVTRVALARHIGGARVRALVESGIEGRDLGVFGDPRVNVLELNLALDRLTARQVRR